MIDRTEAIRRFMAVRSPANREAVIDAHRYLCVRGARKFRRAESDPADLEQVAAIGLIKATDSYCAERTTPFEAYAWLLVVGELMHYVRDHERPIRVPRRLRALERQYVTVWESVAAQQQAEPTPSQLAQALGVGIDEIEQLQAMRRGNRYDLGSSESRHPSPCEWLPAPGCGLSLEERLTVLIAVDELSARERTVVLGTFGAGLSQSEIAATLRLSQSQISKILSRALGKLQRKVA
jgi:RNA polymerase sigma-B factor